eukprot:TRINITY_DN1358_c0_g1_i1.p3 TRINITY_DN1358_c0_g1~~TRINITY_DN1358_c0_g1_i1.p3  ORF type:complete len:669 (+),score=77.24 TRINITY_DN1358_c0_g1_i1:470-2476(+)
MVRSYLSYENYVKEKKKKDFPFYIDWVLSWETHKGMLELTDLDLLSDGCEKCMEKFIKNNEAITGFALTGIVPDDEFTNKLIHIMTTFTVKQIKKLVFKENALNKDSLTKFATSISHQEYLEVLEISYNQLDSNALETLEKLFPSLPSLQELNISHNSITKDGLEDFFKRICEDLELKVLDLSYNQIDDSALKPIIKYLLRNQECTISLLKLTGNKFSAQGIKTLYKAQRLSKKITKNEKNIALELKMVPCRADNINEVLKGEHGENFEILRKPMSGSGALKEVPIKKEWREIITAIEEETKKTMMNTKDSDISSGPEIEDIKEILTRIEALPFEFPIIKFGNLYTFVEKCLQEVVQHDNIYCLEVLLSCAKTLGMDNIYAAEERLLNLSKRCEKVVSDLTSVLNMENGDDNILNELLDTSLVEAEKLGIRGDLIDMCLNLQLIRNRYVEEMQTKTDDDLEIDKLTDDDYLKEKIEDVFAPEFDIFIEKTPTELGLTVDEDQNLGFHPYRADYIAISQLRPERIRQNLKVAADILRHEESYAHENISNRAQFLLCDSFFDHAWGLAKNDKCLNIARVIFRYRNNLDRIFAYIPPPEPVKSLAIQYFSLLCQIIPVELRIQKTPEQNTHKISSQTQNVSSPLKTSQSQFLKNTRSLSQTEEPFASTTSL